MSVSFELAQALAYYSGGRSAGGFPENYGGGKGWEVDQARPLLLHLIVRHPPLMDVILAGQVSVSQNGLICSANASGLAKDKQPLSARQQL